VLEEWGPQALKGVSGSVLVYRVLMKSEVITAFDLRILKAYGQKIETAARTGGYPQPT
jgi:hypothetical protein